MMKWLKRFWSKVTKTPTCWIWRGAIGNSGYGLFRIGTRTLPVHRISYVLAKGDIKAGQQVMHSCDNRKCLNPSHLSLGDIRFNAMDRKLKGRNPNTHGEKNSQAKLAQAQVDEIKRRMAQGVSIPALAYDYGVSKCTIRSILHGRTWAEST